SSRRYSMWSCANSPGRCTTCNRGLHRPLPNRSSSRHQHHPEAGIALDHPLIPFGSFGERKRLDHGTDAFEHTETHGVFRIRGATGWPARDRGALANQLQRRDLDRLRRYTNHDQLAVHAEPPIIALALVTVARITLAPPSPVSTLP